MKRKAKNYGLWANQAIDDVFDILTGKIDGKLDVIEVVLFEFPDGRVHKATTAGEIARLRKVPDVKEID